MHFRIFLSNKNGLLFSDPVAKPNGQYFRLATSEFHVIMVQTNIKNHKTIVVWGVQPKVTFWDFANGLNVGAEQTNEFLP